MTVATDAVARPRVTAVTLEGQHVRLEPLALAHAPALTAAAGGPRDTYRFTLVPPGVYQVKFQLSTTGRRDARCRSPPSRARAGRWWGPRASVI